MKKIILIIAAMLIWNSYINAQNVQCDYQCFIQTIDSLKTALMNDKTIQVPENYWNFNDLSVNERNLVLDYIETLYKQREYMGFYHLGINLLVDLFENDDKKVQDRIARLYLDKVFYGFKESFSKLGRIVDYSDKTKERLRNILERNRTEEDIEARRLLAQRDVRRRDSENIDKEVQKIMKETNRDGEDMRAFLTDSITNIYVEQAIQTMEAYPPFGRFSILEIGGTNDLRFVAGLEKILETDYISLAPDNFMIRSSWESRINSIQRAALYALAKLGVQKYIDEVFKNDANLQWEYLGTTDAFLRWLEINRDWNRWDSFCSNCPVRPAPLVSLWYAQEYYILNDVPRELIISRREIANFCLPDREDCDSEKLENNKLTLEKANELYRWFIDNKDILKLPPAMDRFRFGTR